MIDYILEIPLIKNPQWFINWSDDFIRSFKMKHGNSKIPEYRDAEEAIKAWDAEIIGHTGDYYFIIRFKTQEDLTAFILRWS